MSADKLRSAPRDAQEAYELGYFHPQAEAIEWRWHHIEDVDAFACGQSDCQDGFPQAETYRSEDYTPSFSRLSYVSVLRLIEIGDDRRVAAKVCLELAAVEPLDEVMIIGRTDDGELWAKSSLNAGQSLWLLEKLREHILSGNPWSVV